jgi:hypothetical protein
MVFDAYSQFEESVLTAKMKMAQDSDNDDDADESDSDDDEVYSIYIYNVYTFYFFYTYRFLPITQECDADVSIYDAVIACLSLCCCVIVV